jgi:hypothetical protein
MAWQVGQVQDTDVGGSVGSGFNIVDAATKRPVVTFGYLKPVKAEKAHTLIADALKGAMLVQAHP